MNGKLYFPEQDKDDEYRFTKQETEVIGGVVAFCSQGHQMDLIR